MTTKKMLLSIRKKYQLANIFNSLFKERFKEKLNFDWSKYPSRYEIIQKIIERKKYKNYLEIGCFKNETIDYIILAQKQREISRKWSIAIEQHNIYLS